MMRIHIAPQVRMAFQYLYVSSCMHTFLGLGAQGLGGQGFRALGFMVLGLRGWGLKVLGLMVLGLRVWGFRVLGLRALGFEGAQPPQIVRCFAYYGKEA